MLNLPEIKPKKQETVADYFEKTQNTQTMQQAIERHYKELKKLEEQKMVERADF